MPLAMSDNFWESIFVSVFISIIAIAAVGASVSSQTSAQVSSLSSQNAALSAENTNLQNQVSNLNNELAQQSASLASQIQALQSSFGQSQSGVLIRFEVYELMKDSISGSSVIATCASAPLTDFIKSQTGIDLSNQISSLIQSSLLTASFTLSNMNPTSANIYSVTGDTSIGIEVPSPVGGINLPFHANIGVSATVDVYNLSVSNLSCTTVNVSAG